MKFIAKNSEVIKKQVFYNDKNRYQKSPYIIEHPYNGNILIKNIMTDELLMYETMDEYEADFEYLVKNWYYIDKKFDPSSFCSGLMMDKFEDGTRYSLYPLIPYRYTVFTTMRCNANCPYCFENKENGEYMDEETALKVAEFMATNFNSVKPLELNFFGGEPLVNYKAIDIITNYLYQHNIAYYSLFTSNGYLLNQFSAYKLIHKWHMGGIQITLDGTSDVYNNVKRYKNDDPNPFSQVLDNIEYLLKNRIKVSIRINVALDDIEDLKKLMLLLKDRFSKYFDDGILSIYFSPLFEGCGFPKLNLTDEERQIVSNGVIDIMKLCLQLGILKLRKYFMYSRSYHCMADEPNTLVINANGEFVSCEHYYNDAHGSVFDEFVDLDYKKYWFDQYKEFDYCKNCFKFPVCRSAKNCPVENYHCDKYYSEIEKFKMDIQIESEFVDWFGGLV